ncbi:hypothetical protein K402DRAFT_450859 [Aulographum hederae CBS 113979]|uniref:Uncharacterized protein n=1 Tax=Aulographum hederae CBS 113979 TaxID=1176131 RepID=A0A6G1HE85_9PEZI|nr:hypothetical protein K402DRAFT_450859 [Aulographum hederae CBS 113979]
MSSISVRSAAQNHTLPTANAMQRSRSSTAASNSTKYSLDLSAFQTHHPHGHKPRQTNRTMSDSNLTTPRAPSPDRIDSEDIDGPSDFTQNMSFWMNTNLAASAPNIVRPGQLEEQVDEISEGSSGMGKEVVRDLEEWISGDGESIHSKRSALDENTGEIGNVHGQGPEGEDSQRTSRDTDEYLDDAVADLDQSENGTIEHHSNIESFLDDLPDVEGTIAPGDRTLDINDFPDTRQSSNTLSHQPTVEDYSETPLKSSIGSSASTVIRSSPRGRKEAMNAQPNEAATAGLDASARIAQLESALASTRAELDEVRNNAEKDLSLAFNEYEENLDVHDDEHAREVEELQQAVRDFEADNLKKEADWSAHVEELNRQHAEKMRGYSESAESRVQELEEIIEEQHEREQHRSQLEKQKLDAEESLSAAEARIAELERRVEHMSGSTAIGSEANPTSFRSEDWAAKTELVVHLQRQLEESANRASGAEQEANGLRQKVVDLEAQLADTKSALTKSLADNDSLEQRVQSLQAEYAASSEKATAAAATLVAELADLRSALATSQKDLAESNSLLRKATHEAEIAAETARFRTDELSDELGYARKTVQRLEARVRDLNEADRTARQLGYDMENMREVMHAARKEAERARVEVKKEKNRARSLEKDVEEWGVKHRTTVNEIRSQAEEAVRKVGSLLDKEREKVKKMEKELENTSKLSDEVSALRKQNTHLTTALNTTQNSLDKRNHELGLVKQENEEVNKAMDKRLADMVKEREKAWAAKNAVLKLEKKNMGKVLMREWGKSEFGETGKEQRYAYKYL